MKKITLLVAIAAASTVFVTSCKHSEGENLNKTVKIDSLNTVLNGYEKLFAQINVNEVETITTTIDADIDSAAAICEKKKLTISQDDATFFGRYQALKSGLKKFGTRYNDIKEELNHTKHQLSTLKADINADKLDEEAIAKYTGDEATAVKNLGHAIEQIQGASVTVTGQFKNYRPQFLETLATLGKRK